MSPIRAPRIASTLAALAALLAASAWSPASPRGALPLVHANDNRAAAGRLRHDTLTIRLVVAMAEWRPEADSGPAVEVAAFAEEGKPPEIPGPLLRVPAGTVIHATIRSALTDSTLWLHGFLDRPAARNDSVALRPGETRELRFSAEAPGSYLYWAIPGRHNPDVDDERETTMSLAWLSPDEWRELLERAGFEIEACYGWFDRTPYKGREDTIWVTRRAD